MIKILSEETISRAYAKKDKTPGHNYDGLWSGCHVNEWRIPSLDINIARNNFPLNLEWGFFFVFDGW